MTRFSEHLYGAGGGTGGTGESAQVILYNEDTPNCEEELRLTIHDKRITLNGADITKVVQSYSVTDGFVRITLWMKVSGIDVATMD